jgi:hypothetical protein
MDHPNLVGTALLRSLALAGVCLLGTATAPAWADFGTAVFIAGRVSVTPQAGAPRALTKGAQVGAGDVIRTAARARVQLRFADGAFVSLLPESELGIDAYRFGGSAAGRETAFFALYRGGARFLTGTIGRSHGSRFRATTAIASLEVEKGEFMAIAGRGVQVTVGAGGVIVRNHAGLLAVHAGERAFVSNSSTPPYLVGTAVPYRIAP